MTRPVFVSVATVQRFVHTFLFVAVLALIPLSGLTIQEAATPEGTDKKSSLPLEGSTEKLSFTTDQGTWLSLDVTPDGQSIILEHLGDIYKLPISGGKAERIMGGLAFESQPRVSPDGQWLTFISDRDGAINLWVSKIDGSDARQLTSETSGNLLSPDWTIDSQYVVVTDTNKQNALLMFHRDGGSGLRLGPNSDENGEESGPPGEGNGQGDGLQGVGVHAAPDGRYLYLAVPAAGIGAPAPQLSKIEIGRIDLLTGESSQVTQTVQGSVRPAVSPDGRLLVYATREETTTVLRVRDLVTDSDRRLFGPVESSSLGSFGRTSRDHVPGYAFTPDGQAIVVSSEGRLVRIEVRTGKVTAIPFEVDVDLDVGPRLTSPYRVEQGPVRARLAQDPQYSPDGRRVAASVLTRIYVMDVEKPASMKQLTRDDAQQFKPVWSPDGKWIAYVTWEADTGGHIWRMRANGRGKPQQLTRDPAFYTEIAFSPDGDRIVALRGSQYLRQQSYSEVYSLIVPVNLVWLPAAGGDTTLITPGNGLRHPHVTNDTSRVYAYDGKILVSMRWDGSDRREHLSVSRKVGSETSTAERILVSPDGRNALVVFERQVWVVPLPLNGGTLLKLDLDEPAIPAARITDIGADYISWADGGETITWGLGSTLFRRPLSSVSFRASDENEDDEEKGGPIEYVALDEDDSVDRLEFEVNMPRSRPSGTIVLSGADVIPMSGSTTLEMGSVLRDQDIVVTENRIVSINPHGSRVHPAGAKIVDVSGHYIVPGFIDTHAHWEFMTHDVHQPHSWSPVANLAYGVTAGLDVQTSTKDYLAYWDMVEVGMSVGQRLFMVGQSVDRSSDFKSYKATHAFLRRYKDYYRTPNIKSYMVGNRKQRQWVIQAAKDLALMPTTEAGSSLRLDLTHAIDGMHGNEHYYSAEAPQYDDVIQLYARTRIAFTPTFIVSGNPSGREYFFSRTEVHDDEKLARFNPHLWLDLTTRRRDVWARDDEYAFEQVVDTAARLQRAGGLIGVGGHGEMQGLGVHWEMWIMAMGGMTNPEVLRAATIDGARIIGIDQDLGSIEEGKLADLVILKKNPLEDIRNTNTIRYVMKNGEYYNGDTMDQIWPEEKKLQPFWWWSEKDQ